MMRIEDFEERAMAYGADISVWPDEDHAPARALLTDSAAARAALEEARALDAMLGLWDDPQPSVALLGRVLSDAATVGADIPATASAPPARAGWFAWISGMFSDRPLLRPGLALAACLALGFVMGTSLDEQVLVPVGIEMAAERETAPIDFVFAMEDDADMLLGPGALL